MEPEEPGPKDAPEMSLVHVPRQYVPWPALTTREATTAQGVPQLKDLGKPARKAACDLQE